MPDGATAAPQEMIFTVCSLTAIWAAPSLADTAGASLRIKIDIATAAANMAMAAEFSLRGRLGGLLLSRGLLATPGRRVLRVLGPGITWVGPRAAVGRACRTRTTKGLGELIASRPESVPARSNRRSMVGIDTAIILIAFVLVAAAVAFVVLDMGMTSAQRAKQSINSGLEEASTALQVDGDVMAYVNGNGYVQDVFIPLGVTPGTGYVSFSPSLLSVSLITSKGSFGNIYYGVNQSVTGTSFNLTSIAIAFNNKYGTTDTVAEVYFIHGNITPFVLGPYGQALLVVHLANPLPAYTSFTVVISPSVGGAITVERIIPPNNMTNTIIDLG